MQVKIEHPTTTEAALTIVATPEELTSIKTHVMGHFQGKVKVPGFREGNVPPAVLEKHVDQNMLQTEFLEEGIEQLYSQALQAHKIRPVGQPQISIKKFVPFNTLEFEATVPVIGELKLANYKTMKKPKTEVKLTAKDVDEVLKSLQNQLAEKTDVDRAAKDGDEVWIDFVGTDSKGQPVNGAEGKNYPLTLGSNQFIPGFEDNLLGLKANDEKTYTLTFPKDYGVAALANKDVTFTVTVSKVRAVSLPKLDDAFAAKAGPFKTLADLKADIKKQVGLERQKEADRLYERELVVAIAAKSTVTIPDMLVDQEVERIEQEERQNLIYRGQTWEEHLTEEGVTPEEHKAQKRPQAAERIKQSLVLAEIAEAEGLTVTPEELEIRMQLLKGQYQDPAMQAELAKPETRRDIASRILTEKTLEVIVSYASKK